MKTMNMLSKQKQQVIRETGIPIPNNMVGTDTTEAKILFGVLSDL